MNEPGRNAACAAAVPGSRGAAGSVDGGFSLLEVLIAMVILSVGATSLIALFASASTTHKRAVDRTHAALIAERLFSEVQARYTPQSDLGGILDALERDLPEQIDSYYWEVTLYRPGLQTSHAARRGGFEELDERPEWGPDELVVRVAVQWGEAAQAREEVYSTILLPRLPLAPR